MEQTAESATSPYTVTLGQVYRDEDWMRLSLVLTAQDDSLVGFDTIRADAGGSMPLDTADASGALVLENGAAISQEGVGWFTRQDERTFVMGLNYPMFLYEEDRSLSGEQVTLQAPMGWWPAMWKCWRKRASPGAFPTSTGPTTTKRRWMGIIR